MVNKKWREIDPIPYNGIRGYEFKEFIRGLLVRGRIKDKYIDMLIDDKNMELYNDAFTSDIVDKTHNYQIWELLGDVSAAHFIKYYFCRRFPFLQNALGVKVIARILIHYGAKTSFSRIADKLGFWPYITSSVRQRNSIKMDLLEDVFEAFIGTTEFIIDSKTQVGVGFAIIYDILASVFDEMHISLKYIDLFDARTRLKEIFDYRKDIGVIDYITVKPDNINYTTVYRIVGGYANNPKKGGTLIEIGKGSSYILEESEENAAENAIANLKSQNIYKPIDPYYETIKDAPQQYPIKGLDKKDLFDSETLYQRLKFRDIKFVKNNFEKYYNEFLNTYIMDPSKDIKTIKNLRNISSLNNKELDKLANIFKLAVIDKIFIKYYDTKNEKTYILNSLVDYDTEYWTYEIENAVLEKLEQKLNYIEPI